MSLKIIEPHMKDIGGGFTVRRSLPAAAQRSVGPFVFFDHFGPATVTPAENHDVRPHPHIGLATVTYLYEGTMLHRDSLGMVQQIDPGAINLMVSGRGIVHSERSPEAVRNTTRVNHGLQLWLALPESEEESDPAFFHTPARDIPGKIMNGGTVRVLIGEAYGLSSPVIQRSPTLYVDYGLPPGVGIRLPASAVERAVYAVDADLELEGQRVARHTMAVLEAGTAPVLRNPAVVGAPAGVAKAVLIGGAPLGHRFMWWNFVSSRKERIDRAADDWRNGRFAAVPGETEFIPLPD